MPRTLVDKVGNQYRRFNDLVRGEMRRRHVKQADLAERLNIKQTGVSHRLGGHSEWTFREILKCCDYLEIDISEIFS